MKRLTIFLFSTLILGMAWFTSCEKNAEGVLQTEIKTYTLFETVHYYKNDDGTFSLTEDKNLVKEKLFKLLTAEEDIIQEINEIGFTMTIDEEEKRPYFFIKATSNEDKILTGFVFVDNKNANIRDDGTIYFCAPKECCQQCSGVTNNGNCYCTNTNHDCQTVGSCGLIVFQFPF